MQAAYHGGANSPKAYEISHGMETAQRQASELQAGTKSSQTINRVQQQRQGTQRSKTIKPTDSSPCYRCGRSNHLPEVCFCRRQKCRNCKNMGHLARMCMQAKPQQTYLVEDSESKAEFSGEKTHH